MTSAWQEGSTINFAHSSHDEFQAEIIGGIRYGVSEREDSKRFKVDISASLSAGHFPER